MTARLSTFLKHLLYSLRYEEAMCKGVFHTYEKALRHARRKGTVGYNQPDYTEYVTKQLNKENLSTMDPRDFVNMWFIHSFIKDTPGETVIDFGGGAGIHFLRYKNFLSLSRVNWHIIETPAMVSAAKKILQIPNLYFHANPEEIGNEHISLLFSSGTLQYLNPTEYDTFITFIKNKKPTSVILTRITVGSHSCFTLQRIPGGYTPLRIFKTDDLIQEWEKLGYTVNHHITLFPGHIIPFHFKESNNAYACLVLSCQK